jgi:hypothetical protein
MAALTTVWTVSGVHGTSAAPAQVGLLRRISRQPRLLAFGLPGFHRIPAAEVPARLRIEAPTATAPGGAGPNDRPLYQVPFMPAGEYRLRFEGAGAAGWVMIGIGRDQFSLRSEPLAAPGEPIVVNFPVDIRAIVVRGDEQARRTIQGLTIEPLAIVLARARLFSGFARRAVRYGHASVFFLDYRSYPEPEAFWIGGAGTSSFVLQPDAARTAVSLQIRNAPVDNVVALRTGGWREDLRLGPGEERRLQVPLDVRRGATLLSIAASAGFRPSASDASSRDDRFLGVWIKILD